MKLVEQNATRYGLSYKVMMENAGTACARNIRSKIEKDNVIIPKSIVVVCGKGNNGGDCFVIARKLRETGYSLPLISSVHQAFSAVRSAMLTSKLTAWLPTGTNFVK